MRADAKIVYIVPSRALVNQVYYDLKSDLGDLNISVEKTSSAIEIDPTENEFLACDKIDILVSTPEKLDLLIRGNTLQWMMYLYLLLTRLIPLRMVTVVRS